MSEKIKPVAWAMTDYQPEANTQYTGDKYAAEHWGSQGIQIEPLFSATTVSALEARIAELEDVLAAIRQYGSDTLSGRADGGQDDREWQRDAVREMTKRARIGLGIKLPGEES